MLSHLYIHQFFQSFKKKWNLETSLSSQGIGWLLYNFPPPIPESVTWHQLSILTVY